MCYKWQKIVVETSTLNSIRCGLCLIQYDVMFYFLKFICLLYCRCNVIHVVCKGTGYWGQSLSKSKWAYEPNYIMKHVDVTGILLHYDLSCWYVCMKSNEVDKMYFETIYVTEIGNKMQNNCKT